MGFADTGVLPLDVDIGRIRRAPPEPALEHSLNDGLTNFLFVGRIAPNKKIEDIIRLAEHYRRYVDAYYRFIFVGRYDAHAAATMSMLRALIAKLGWRPTGSCSPAPCPDDELAAYYRGVERLHLHERARRASACRWSRRWRPTCRCLRVCRARPSRSTLGGAACEFAPKDFEHAAELLGLLAFDDDVRRQVIAGQRRRLTHFSSGRVDGGLRALAGRFQ